MKDYKTINKLINNISNRFFLIFILCVCNTISINAQIPINRVDSLGLKIGFWREYKIKPYRTLELNKLIPDPFNTKKLYIADKHDFGEKCIIFQCFGFYENGLKTGIWLEYYPNDSIKSKIEYKNGVPFGICKMYWNNGILKLQCKIDYEKKIELTLYDETGNKLDEVNVLKSALIKSIYED